VERVPWAPARSRVTRALARAVAVWARRLNWTDTAELFGVNWKAVVKIVRRAVAFGLRRRRLEPVTVLGVDEVSRAKGHKYFTLFYDLKRSLLLWVGEDRTEETAKAFFDWFGDGVKHVTAACLDMWVPYVAAFKERAAKAVLVFDRFHLVRHLNAAVDEVRRAMVRELKGEARTEMKGTRYLWLKNPWNLKVAERPRLAALLQQHLPIVKAYLLKESFRDFWSHGVREEARKFLKHWFWMATHSRLSPLREFAWRLRRHEEGILAWIDLRISNGAVEGMNTKIQTVSRRAFGFRTSSHFKLAIYHCCADLPLPS
jgi:transposase